MSAPHIIIVGPLSEQRQAQLQAAADERGVTIAFAQTLPGPPADPPEPCRPAWPPPGGPVVIRHAGWGDGAQARAQLTSRRRYPVPR